MDKRAKEWFSDIITATHGSIDEENLNTITDIIVRVIKTKTPKVRAINILPAHYYASILRFIQDVEGDRGTLKVQTDALTREETYSLYPKPEQMYRSGFRMLGCIASHCSNAVLLVQTPVLSDRVAYALKFGDSSQELVMDIIDCVFAHLAALDIETPHEAVDKLTKILCIYAWDARPTVSKRTQSFVKQIVKGLIKSRHIRQFVIETVFDLATMSMSDPTQKREKLSLLYSTLQLLSKSDFLAALLSGRPDSKGSLDYSGVVTDVVSALLKVQRYKDPSILEKAKALGSQVAEERRRRSVLLLGSVVSLTYASGSWAGEAASLVLYQLVRSNIGLRDKNAEQHNQVLLKTEGLLSLCRFLSSTSLLRPRTVREAQGRIRLLEACVLAVNQMYQTAAGSRVAELDDVAAAVRLGIGASLSALASARNIFGQVEDPTALSDYEKTLWGALTTIVGVGFSCYLSAIHIMQTQGNMSLFKAAIGIARHSGKRLCAAYTSAVLEASSLLSLKPLAKMLQTVSSLIEQPQSLDSEESTLSYETVLGLLPLWGFLELAHEQHLAAIGGTPTPLGSFLLKTIVTRIPLNLVLVVLPLNLTPEAAAQSTRQWKRVTAVGNELFTRSDNKPIRFSRTPESYSSPRPGLVHLLASCNQGICCPLEAVNSLILSPFQTLTQRVSDMKANMERLAASTEDASMEQKQRETIQHQAAELMTESTRLASLSQQLIQILPLIPRRCPTLSSTAFGTPHAEEIIDEDPIPLQQELLHLLTLEKETLSQSKQTMLPALDFLIHLAKRILHEKTAELPSGDTTAATIFIAEMLGTVVSLLNSTLESSGTQSGSAQLIRKILAALPVMLAACSDSGTLSVEQKAQAEVLSVARLAIETAAQVPSPPSLSTRIAALGCLLEGAAGKIGGTVPLPLGRQCVDVVLGLCNLLVSPSEKQSHTQSVPSSVWKSVFQLLSSLLAATRGREELKPATVGAFKFVNAALDSDAASLTGGALRLLLTVGAKVALVLASIPHLLSGGETSGESFERRFVTLCCLNLCSDPQAGSINSKTRYVATDAFLTLYNVRNIVAGPGQGVESSPVAQTAMSLVVAGMSSAASSFGPIGPSAALGVAGGIHAFVRMAVGGNATPTQAFFPFSNVLLQLLPAPGDSPTTTSLQPSAIATAHPAVVRAVLLYGRTIMGRLCTEQANATHWFREMESHPEAAIPINRFVDGLIVRSLFYATAIPSGERVAAKSVLRRVAIFIHKGYRDSALTDGSAEANNAPKVQMAERFDAARKVIVENVDTRGGQYTDELQRFVRSVLKMVGKVTANNRRNSLALSFEAEDRILVARPTQKHSADSQRGQRDTDNDEDKSIVSELVELLDKNKIAFMPPTIPMKISEENEEEEGKGTDEDAGEQDEEVGGRKRKRSERDHDADKPLSPYARRKQAQEKATFGGRFKLSLKGVKKGSSGHTHVDPYAYIPLVPKLSKQERQLKRQVTAIARVGADSSKRGGKKRQDTTGTRGHKRAARDKRRQSESGVEQEAKKTGK